MRSSTGYYNRRLDHVRAIAAFIVCYYHFVHLSVPTSYVPDIFPLSLLEEGHTGVALFMTLSGFLFARIVGDHSIDVGAFAKNRLLRLAPLLVVAFSVHAVLGQTTVYEILAGFVWSTWPGVAWSITPELHFYLLFPFLLVAIRRFGLPILLVFIAAAVVVRFAVWFTSGEVQNFAYRTIGGRADQFLWGALFGFAASRGAVFFGWRKWMAPVVVVAFLLFWHQFNTWGGYYHLVSNPSPSPVWIVLPSIEGLAYATFIAWYAELALQLPRTIDRPLAWLGTVSFSIYIWHWLLLAPLWRGLFALGVPRATFAEASLGAIAFFACVAVVGGLSYALIERPFLRMRVSYVLGRTTASSMNHPGLRSI